MNNIRTERLMLIPADYNLVQSLHKGQYDVIEGMGLKLGLGWPRNDTKTILGVFSQIMEASKEPSGFEFWMIVKDEDKTIIGDIGFKGAPNDKGEVEIGYGIIESEWRNGYGYEAVQGLVNWAFAQTAVNIVKASCLWNNQGSIGILRKLAMEEVSRDEELIHWELHK